MTLTHIDGKGNAVMVDVGGKPATEREAAAEGRIRMSAECFAAIQGGAAKKGDVLGVAQVAGIMAVKRTPELIPLCHVLNITKAGLELTLHPDKLEVEAVCTVRTYGQTGVEMEALTGVSVALLTVYDMCKAMDKGMEIHSIRLTEKSGGKSGRYQRNANVAPSGEDGKG
ncbi:MAG: cyclic pyranopterin monophosphate synthase MoaC [Clostridiales bacterium]|nr:cyclic pyranopterin monophosphate synthase MoaC [Clostridiales bacterium]